MPSTAGQADSMSIKVGSCGSCKAFLSSVGSYQPGRWLQQCCSVITVLGQELFEHSMLSWQQFATALVTSIASPLRLSWAWVRRVCALQDATSMLPSMSLQPLKPSSLVRRPVELTASKYGYSRAKPLKVLQKQV